MHMICDVGGIRYGYSHHTEGFVDVQSPLLTHSLTHSPTHLPNHSPTHSLTLLSNNTQATTLLQHFSNMSVVYNHCHIAGTRTSYLSRPLAPTRSMLFTNCKSANSETVRFPTLNGEKG